MDYWNNTVYKKMMGGCDGYTYKLIYETLQIVFTMAAVFIVTIFIAATNKLFIAGR